ncbi:MAG: hypothetical protein HUK08_00165 [Bacteroidaceae bacterium]|nr:hypothetical protein [Bacteroidaceae bacterium]
MTDIHSGERHRVTAEQLALCFKRIERADYPEWDSSEEAIERIENGCHLQQHGREKDGDGLWDVRRMIRANFGNDEAFAKDASVSTEEMRIIGVKTYCLKTKYAPYCVTHSKHYVKGIDVGYNYVQRVADWLFDTPDEVLKAKLEDVCGYSEVKVWVESDEE